jgi:hypothetical protein
MSSHVYIKLFHGRKDPNQNMDDWGDPGPILGPFQWVHGTYCNDLKLGDINSPSDSLGELPIYKDLVYYDGVFYGDFSVIAPDTAKEDEAEIQEFDPEKAKLSIEAAILLAEENEKLIKE